MYPGTIVNEWIDNSGMNQDTPIVDIENKPLFMVVGSFDKGPEKLMEIEGADFYNLFGSMSFVRHGQNAIQAKRIIDAGGRLLIKRVCASDSTLANIVITAKVTIAENKAKILYQASSIAGAKTFKEVVDQAKATENVSSGIFPLMVITDNGRGDSSKAIRITPDYTASKNMGSMFYSMITYEGTNVIETQPFTLDPDVVYSNTSYGLDQTTNVQTIGKVIDEVYADFVAKIADGIGSTVDEVKANDLLFGYDLKGSALADITIDTASVDLYASYGVTLQKGSNGAFGTAPVNTTAWADAIKDVYDGNVTDEVYDLDMHKVAAIVDANFPWDVKESIAKFVNFRKDCVFFRDLGTGLNTFLAIQEAYSQHVLTRSRFIADYASSYQIKDPGTRKNVEVTMMYDFAACLVPHIVSSAHNPLAGTINGFILSSAIPGTLNFTPTITPRTNQKASMEDIRLNYALWQEDSLVVQTLYTSQDKSTQLSYVNNVLAIQEAIRAVRVACPKSRYSLISGDDLSNYERDVNKVLSNFRSNFAILNFAYTQDPLKAYQKIFYASIEVAFNNWVQTEMFDIYAINNND